MIRLPRLRFREVELWGTSAVQLTDTPRPNCPQCHGDDPGESCPCWNPRLSLPVWIESPQLAVRAPRDATAALATAVILPNKPKGSTR